MAVLHYSSAMIAQLSLRVVGEDVKEMHCSEILHNCISEEFQSLVVQRAVSMG